MKEKKHYISLSFKGGNRYHKNGKCLKQTERIINIGETADCDVRYEANGLSPEYYASIIKNKDGDSWRIVKRSQHIDVSIEGKGPVGYAQQLTSGDRIRFDNQDMALCFHTHHDNNYDDARQDNVKRLAIVATLFLLAIIIVALGLNNRQDNITGKDVEPLEESVCLIRVDSVRRILTYNGQEEWLPPTKVLESNVPVGSAFLTPEGRLITARHCVEYWIGENLDLTTRVEELRKDDIVRWAIETETFNQTHDSDSAMTLRVFFSVLDFMGNKKYSFSSTDKNVHINKEKDGIFLLADFSHDYYWRSVRPYFKDRQMELGDILWIDSIPEQGKITTASPEQISKVKNGTKLMVCGYPMTGFGDRKMTFTEGTIRRNTSTENENLFFESNINHGFSGGPILMKDGTDIIAIGVVSRVDSISSGLYKLAVPISEIKDEK